MIEEASINPRSSAFICGPFSLGHLCPFILRRHDQLHRSPGDRNPQANPSNRNRLDRSWLQLGRLFFPGRLRDWPARRRTFNRSHRHAQRILTRHHLLEHRGDGPCTRAYSIRLRRCSLLSRSGRSGKLSGSDQDSRRMVSEKRTRPRNRNLQLRYQHRRARDATRRANHYDQVRLARGFHRHGRDRFHLARSRGGHFIDVPKNIPLCPKPNWNTSRAIHPIRWCKYRGHVCCRTGKRGRSLSQSS